MPQPRTLRASASRRTRFADLAQRWHSETGGMSSATQIAANTNYLKIIAMGQTAVPFILEDLRDKGGLWYPALAAITGANPLLPEDRGFVPRMKEAWLNWGVQNGYLREMAHTD